MSRREDSWGLIGGSVLMLACAPRVSATLVITEPEDDADDEAEPVAEQQAKPKRARPATTNDDLHPPTVVRAELLNATILRIHFSEPIAELGNFDPNDFRISVFDFYSNTQNGYTFAYYYDFGYQSIGQAMRFTSLRKGSVELDLYFTPEIGLTYCRQFDAYNYNYSPPGARAETGLFLHYAAGSVPLRDSSEDALANFGAEWVTLGRMDPPEMRRELHDVEARGAGKGLIPVACGPEIPPGPR